MGLLGLILDSKTSFLSLHITQRKVTITSTMVKIISTKSAQLTLNMQNQHQQDNLFCQKQTGLLRTIGRVTFKNTHTDYGGKLIGINVIPIIRFVFTVRRKLKRYMRLEKNILTLRD